MSQVKKEKHRQTTITLPQEIHKLIFEYAQKNYTSFSGAVKELAIKVLKK